MNSHPYHRSEVSVEDLIVSYMDQCCAVGAWSGVMRLQWVLNSSVSSQHSEADLVVLSTIEKFKTL